MNTLDKTESGIVKTSFGKLCGVIINSHTNGTLKFVDGLESGVAASTILTSSGACVPAYHATSKLTVNTVVANNTVTIGTKVYKAVAVLTGAANEVFMDDTDAKFLINLKKAINVTGIAGTDYGVGTVSHTDVIATTLTATTMVIVARKVGNDAFTTAINALPTTGVAVKAVWEDTTLGGGTGDSNPAVTTAAATFTLGTVTYTAVIELSETSGAAAVANEVLWVTNEATFLDNIKAAVNLSGIAGTNYSTGTAEHPTVKATTNTATQQTFIAKLIGVAGNSIATTETLGNYAFTSTVMASGTGATGKVMHNTITLGAAERFLDMKCESFDRGLYIEVGGTIDYSVIYE